MSSLLDRWNRLQPREQWLALLVLSTLVLVLWSDAGRLPLQREVLQLQTSVRESDAREQQARAELLALQTRSANRPDLALRTAVQDARVQRDGLLDQLQRDTRALVSPRQMQKVLRELLQQRRGLQLLALENFRSVMQPTLLTGVSEALSGREAGLQHLYRHGLRLTLEGSYFELRDYLQAVEANAGGVLWQAMDYQVGEAGPDRARIVLEVFTLSSEEGWIGV